MKKFFFQISAVLLMASSLIIKAHAEPVDITDALNIARAKVLSLGKSSSFSVETDANKILDDQRQILCFLFLLEPSGFIIVAADDNLPPVLGYDFSADFPVDAEASKLFLQMIKADIKLRLANIENLPIENILKRKEEWNRLMKSPEGIEPDFLFQQWPPEGSTSTGGWLETNYTQSPPYNNFCPMDPVTIQRSVAGCPATAMAQVVNYYRTINNTSFTDNDDYHHNYAGRNYWIDNDYFAIDFPSFPDLNAYLDTVAMKFESGSSLKNSEKAALTFACGVAAHQVYTSQGSGTFGVSQAEEAYLRFGFLDALLLESTDTSLFTQLSQNMMAARPAHLAIVDPGWTMGHNVVVDGYNTDEYYHLNFGWGGGYNGWYLLPDEIPYGLTVIEGLIVNIAFAPVNTGVTIQSVETGLSLSLFPNPTWNLLQVEFVLSKPSQVKIAIYNMDGGFIYPIMNELMQAGDYIKSINLIQNQVGLTTGLYLCKLQADKKILTKKFIVR
jgi:hypothetical protein